MISITYGEGGFIPGQPNSPDIPDTYAPGNIIAVFDDGLTESE